MVEWLSGGVVEWWSGGVVEWWSGGVVEWLSGWVVATSFRLRGKKACLSAAKCAACNMCTVLQYVLYGMQV